MMTEADIIAAIVKPLEWQDPSHKNNYTHIAPSFFGDYYVHVDGGLHQAWLEAHVKPYENVIGEVVGHLAAAQAAAEADYRARIAAALDLGKIVTLVEAATPYVSPMQTADFGRQIRQHDALVASLAALQEKPHD